MFFEPRSRMHECRKFLERPQVALGAKTCMGGRVADLLWKEMMGLPPCRWEKVLDYLRRTTGALVL